MNRYPSYRGGGITSLPAYAKGGFWDNLIGIGKDVAPTVLKLGATKMHPGLGFLASLLDTARTGGSAKKWLTESALNSQFVNAFERGQKKAFEGQFTPEELEMLSDLADERGISIQEVLKSGDIGDAGDYTGGWDEDIFREGFKGPSQSAVQSNLEMFEAMSPTERAKNPTMQQIFGDRYGDLPGQFEDYKSTLDSLGSAGGLSSLMSGASEYMTDNQQVMLALLELDQQMKRDKSPFKYRGGGDRIMPRSSDSGYTPRARGAQGSSTAQYADGGKIPSYLTGGEVYAAYKLAKQGYGMYKGLKGEGDGPDAPSGDGDGGMDNWEKARAAAEIGKDLYSIYNGLFGDKDDGSGMYGMGMQGEPESLANTQATLDSMLNERQGYSDLITQKSHGGVIPDYENGGSIKLMDMSELDEFNKFHSKEEDLERIIKNFSRQGFADPIRPMAYGGLIPGYENGGENGDEHDEPEDYYRPPTPDDKADAYAKAKAASEAREAARRKARGEPERPDDWDSMSFDQKQAWFNQNESTPEEELARKKAEAEASKKAEARKKAEYEAQQQANRDAEAARSEAARARAEAERARLEALRTGGGGNGGNGGNGGGGGNGNGGNGGNGNGNGNGNGGGGGTERTKPTVTERTAPGPNATQEEIDAWNNYLTAEGERQRKAVADKAAADAAAKRGDGENTHNTTSSVTDNTEPDDPIPADDDPDGKKRKKEDVAPSGKYDKDGNLIVDPNYKPKYYTPDGKRPTNTYSYDRRAPIMPTSSTRGGGRSEDVVEDPTDPSYRAGLHSERSRTTGEGTFHGADPFADLGSPEAGSRYAGLVNRLNEPPLDRSAYGKAKAASEAREPAFRRARGEPERPGNWDSMSFDQKQAWFNQNEPTPEEELARKKAERTDINSGVDIYGNPLEAPDPNRMPVRGGGGEGERSVGEHSLYNDELLINSGPRRPVAGEGGPGPGTGPQEGERSVYRPPPPDFADVSDEFGPGGGGYRSDTSGQRLPPGPREKLRLPGHQEGGETSQETSGLPREIFDIAMAALNQQVPQSEQVVAMLMDQYPEEMIELITRITDSSRGQQMASQVQQMNLGGIVTRGYIPEFADGGMESSGAVDDRVAVSKDDLVEEDFQDRLQNGGPLDVVAALAPNEYIITAEQTTESDPQDMIQAAEAIPADTPPGAAVWDSFTNNLDRVI